MIVQNDTHNIEDQRTPVSNFLTPRSWENIFYLRFWAIFDQNFDKSSEPAELNERRESCNSAKWPQFNPYEMGEKNSNFSSQKIQKIDFLVKKWPKMTKNSKIFEIFSIFLVGIDSEWSKIYFKTEISISKKIPIMFWHSHFFEKWGHKSKKWKDKNFWSKNFFWSKSIQNGLKRILKHSPKSSSAKISNYKALINSSCILSVYVFNESSMLPFRPLYTHFKSKYLYFQCGHHTLRAHMKAEEGVGGEVPFFSLWDIDVMMMGD